MRQVYGQEHHTYWSHYGCLPMKYYLLCTWLVLEKWFLHFLQSSPTGPALQEEGGSLPKSCNSYEMMIIEKYLHKKGQPSYLVDAL